MNWYYHLNGQNVGPITEEDLKARLARGEIGADTPVWCEGMKGWLPLSQSGLRVGSAARVEKNLIEYYVSVLKNYAVFRGRARRSEYWFFFLCNFFVSGALTLTGAVTHLYWLDGLYRLAVMVPICAVAVRRMHDVDKSGWYMWIPIYNIVLACRPGTVGPNRFGPDPKNPSPFDQGSARTDSHQKAA